jgi:citrate lyase subunit beta/citryl-CoA lyase
MHPRTVLLGASAGQRRLPVCDHYSGVESRMLKSLQLQLEYQQEFGVCVFDVTLDCEDGAPAGGELDHCHMVGALVNSARATSNLIAGSEARRIGVRVHAVEHHAFETDVKVIVSTAGQGLNYVMVPKVESVAHVDRAAAAVDASTVHGCNPIPLHVLIESPLAVHRAFEIAAHPRVESVSFGIMDFVSAHGGSIPAQAMGVGKSDTEMALDQFHHPLVLRAKAEIASACHAHGKVPSHCVVTDFQDSEVLERSARTAANRLGFARMWSIHPSQIRPILRAFAPDIAEVDQAADVIAEAHAQRWAPIALSGRLYDRASYRYFWQLLERAHQTGVALPSAALPFFVACHTE